MSHFFMVAILALLVIAIVIFIFDLLHRRKAQKQNKQDSIKSKQQLDLKIAQQSNKFNDAIAKMNTDLRSQIQQTSTRSISQMQHDAQLIGGGISNISNNANSISSNVSSIAAIATQQKQLSKKNTDSLKRLQYIIAGTQTKGQAGQNIIDNFLSNIPVQWQVKNFQVNGKPVQFGIKLPNKTICPIDSKWSSTGLMQKFIKQQDVDARKKIKSQIQDSLMRKAKQVAKYIDPSITASYGIMVVPDTIYNISSGVSLRAFQIKVIIISYSLFLPYILMMYQMAAISNNTIDMNKVNSYLLGISDSVNAIQEQIDSRMARAITMLNNTRDDIRVNLTKAKNGINNIQK